MQQHMKDRRRYPLAAALTLAATLLLPVIPLAHAQDSRKDTSVILFRGDLTPESNVRLGSWGSGQAVSSRDHVLTGDSSILLTTQGFYQGGIISFQNPVDFTEAFSNPNTYLELRVRFEGASNGGGGFGGGGRGGFNGPPGGGGRNGPPGGFNGPPGGGGRNGPPGGFNGPPGGLRGGAPGGGGFDPFDEEAGRNAVPFDRMRYLLRMADKTTFELVRPVSVTPSDDPGGYVTIAFPLSALLKKADGTMTPPPSGDGARLHELVIFGDKPGAFNIGEVSVVTDETPISAQPLDVPPVFTDDSVPFVGSAEGGASTLRYTWDFDASDGIQVDAEGRSVTHVYHKPGNYTVTLTVSDVDGIKKPVIETVSFDVTG
jgi:hypothetical protein